MADPRTETSMRNRLALSALFVLASTAACSKKDDPGPAASGSANVRGGAGPAGSAWNVPAGTYVVDSGFRPAKNGFKFPNEGSVGEEPWLTAADMRKLFGDANVCMP